MKELIQSVYNSPKDWKVNAHTFVYKDRFQMWTANGFSSFRPYQSSVNVTFIQKLRMWKAFKWWCVNAPLEKF